MDARSSADIATRPANGVIAIAALRSRARFRIWGEVEPSGWDTDDGDVVIIRGTRWPTASSLCPLHEAESMNTERFALTFRHNTRAAGAKLLRVKPRRRCVGSGMPISHPIVLYRGAGGERGPQRAVWRSERAACVDRARTQCPGSHGASTALQDQRWPIQRGGRVVAGLATGPARRREQERPATGTAYHPHRLRRRRDGQPVLRRGRWHVVRGRPMELD
jgi:hypothetical protein